MVQPWAQLSVWVRHIAEMLTCCHHFCVGSLGSSHLQKICQEVDWLDESAQGGNNHMNWPSKMSVTIWGATLIKMKWLKERAKKLTKLIKKMCIMLYFACAASFVPRLLDRNLADLGGLLEHNVEVFWHVSNMVYFSKVNSVVSLSDSPSHSK